MPPTLAHPAPDPYRSRPVVQLPDQPRARLRTGPPSSCHTTTTSLPPDDGKPRRHGLPEPRAPHPEPRVRPAAGRPSPSTRAVHLVRGGAGRAGAAAGSTAARARRRPRRPRRARGPRRPAAPRRRRAPGRAPSPQSCRSEPATTTATTSTARCSCRAVARRPAPGGRRRSAAAGPSDPSAGASRPAGRSPLTGAQAAPPALREGAEQQRREQRPGDAERPAADDVAQVVLAQPHPGEPDDDDQRHPDRERQIRRARAGQQRPRQHQRRRRPAWRCPTNARSESSARSSRAPPSTKSRPHAAEVAS